MTGYAGRRYGRYRELRREKKKDINIYKEKKIREEKGREILRGKECFVDRKSERGREMYFNSVKFCTPLSAAGTWRKYGTGLPRGPSGRKAGAISYIW